MSNNFESKVIPSRVIMLHYIETDLGSALQTKGSRYLLKWDIVKKGIQYALNSGVRFEALHQNGKYTFDPDVRITVDDGGASSFKIAEQLRDLNIKGYFFIATNFIDQKDFLTKHQIYMIDRMGHEIGSHGHIHANPFCELSNDEIVNEVNHSKMLLEKLLKKKIKIFSVPGGEIRSNTLTKLKDPQLSLNEIYTSVPVQGFLSKKHSHSVLIYGRLCIERNMTSDQIYKYFKGYNWLYMRLDYKLRRFRREILYKVSGIYKKIFHG